MRSRTFSLTNSWVPNWLPSSMSGLTLRSLTENMRRGPLRMIWMMNGTSVIKPKINDNRPVIRSRGIGLNFALLAMIRPFSSLLPGGWTEKLIFLGPTYSEHFRVSDQFVLSLGQPETIPIGLELGRLKLEILTFEWGQVT